MSKIMFVTWSGGGNQPPAIGLAQQLRDSGHDIVFAGYADQVARFAPLGFPVVLLSGANEGWDRFDPDNLYGFLTDRVWACPDHPADIEAVLEQELPDLVVVDCLMTAALAALEKTALPTVVLVHSTPGALCPPGRDLDQLLLGRLNPVRALLGLDPMPTVWAAWEQHSVLCASISELDPLAAEVSSDVNWVGPIFEQASAAAWAPPGPDHRPLVLVSFSSGPAWDQTSRIQRSLDGLAGYGVRVLATTGAVEPTALRWSDDSATVLPYLPHSAVLAHAAAVVTHAGHGTLTAALAQGLPVVCLPNFAADQPALAEQVARLGAGIHLDGDRAQPEDIRHAVEQVLTDPSYAAAAAQLADRMTEQSAERGAYLDRVLSTNAMGPS